MSAAAVAELGVIADAHRRQRRRRRLIAAGLITAVSAAGAVLYLPGRPSDHARPPANAARAVPWRVALARTPEMGVACERANFVVCDRVGLAVWLRRPARSVTAVLAGRRFALSDSEWGGQRHNGRKAMFAGFLQPAGIVDRLGVRPDRNGRWLGDNAPTRRVRLRIDFSTGDSAVTTVDVLLTAGWG
jgi:hypothetical protein